MRVYLYVHFRLFAISEVFALAEQYSTATILSSADVDQDRARVVQQRYPTLHLKPAATARDIIWELNHAAGFRMVQ
jgi:hypothetical protein